MEEKTDKHLWELYTFIVKVIDASYRRIDQLVDRIDKLDAELKNICDEMIKRGLFKNVQVVEVK